MLIRKKCKEQNGDFAFDVNKKKWKNKIIYCLGLKLQKCTSDDIFNNLSHIPNNIDNKKVMGAVHFVLSKVFDTICHSKLLDKLLPIGICRTSNKWLS